MSVVWLLAINFAVVMAIMTFVWAISLLVKDVSIVDMVWGAGFVVVAWTTFSLSGGIEGIGSLPARKILLLVLPTVWGLRLTAYLVWRNLGEPEDYRYREMRERSRGVFALTSLFYVFGLQGLLMWVISTPIQLGQLSANALSAIDIAGVAVWTIGLFFESVGDYQLARFKADPSNKGQVMDRGLWRFTRHPNYFGDFLIWWGMYLIAAAGGAWWTIYSPLIMSVFLMRVSGVTLLEKTLVDTKPKYADYARRTNAFFPWIPRPISPNENHA